MRAGAAGVLIVMLLSGCDNVSWGGAALTIVPPPPKSSGERLTEPHPGGERLPDGPILYYVTTEPRGGVLHPVAEISGDSLRLIDPGQNARAYADVFIAQHMRQGAEFVLYRGGSRAGTLIVQSADLEASSCRPLPRAVGTLELRANGEGATEFLALSRLTGPQEPRRSAEPLVPSSTMRTLAPILVEPMLRARGAPLPGDWQRAMAQLRPFPVAGATAPGFTATFVIADTLGPGLDDQGHSVFYIALPQSWGFDTTYVQFRNYAQDGKQAPRVIDHLDWDRDGEVELVLQVYGTNDTWLEAIGRGTDGRWRTIFRNRCEGPMTPPDSAS